MLFFQKGATIRGSISQNIIDAALLDLNNIKSEVIEAINRCTNSGYSLGDNLSKDIGGNGELAPSAARSSMFLPASNGRVSPQSLRNS